MAAEHCVAAKRITSARSETTRRGGPLSCRPSLYYAPTHKELRPNGAALVQRARPSNHFALWVESAPTRRPPFLHHGGQTPNSSPTSDTYSPV